MAHRNSAYCRLSVILAREAPKGVIIRRGPSLWTQVIAWDTQTDTFEEGQWFKGRIYARRCDLSPDGSKLIYFAAKHTRRQLLSSYKDSWTAISRSPYLTALALWPAGETHGGGGYFEDNATVRLNSPRRGDPMAHPDHLPPEGLTVKKVLDGSHFFYEDDLYFSRLQRNGWVMTQEGVFSDEQSYKQHERARSFKRPEVWQKDSPNRKYRIILKYVGTDFGKPGDYQVSNYSLQHIYNSHEIPIDTDTWADWDHRGWLVYAHEGKLFVGEPHEKEIVPRLIADFNPNRPRLIESPGWARTWD